MQITIVCDTANLPGTLEDYKRTQDIFVVGNNDYYDTFQGTVTSWPS